MFELLTSPDAGVVAARSSAASGAEVGYDAVRTTGRRQPPKQRLMSEDRLLRDKDRDRLSATQQDIRRNFAVAAWMIRKHLDFVASFDFQPQPPAWGQDDAMQAAIETYIDWRSQRENMDVARRHRRERLVRITEALRCVHGDAAWFRLNSGRVQAIEGDRIRTPRQAPRDFDPSRFENGVRTNRAGEALAYAVCNRTKRGAGFELARVVPARHLWLHGFFDRVDQVRGVSPIAASVNTFRDAYEGIDFALARAKVSQLFALAIFSEDKPDPGIDAELADAEGENGEDAGDGDRYSVDFSKGPLKLELDQGDQAKFLESQQPSDQFREFMQVTIMIALKSLDIPFSFFDESFTNFFGSRGGLIHYLKSCESKRADLVELLDAWTRWQLEIAVEDGDLMLPRGRSIDELRWTWVPRGVPWWDPAKEARGHGMAVGAAFDTFQNVVKTTGGGTGDVFKNIDANAEVLDYARKKGVPLTLPGSSAFDPEPVITGDGEGGNRDA